MKTPVSARIDETLIRFLDAYQQRHGVATRSEALEQAIRALRERSLAHEYERAMDEWAASDDAELWDATAGDGLGSDAGGSDAGESDADADAAR